MVRVLVWGADEDVFLGSWTGSFAALQGGALLTEVALVGMRPVRIHRHLRVEITVHDAMRNHFFTLASNSVELSLAKDGADVIWSGEGAWTRCFVPFYRVLEPSEPCRQCRNVMIKPVVKAPWDLARPRDLFPTVKIMFEDRWRVFDERDWFQVIPLSVH